MGTTKTINLRIKELERLYRIELGNNRYEKNSHLKPQEQLAKEMGMDLRTLQNYKMLEDMISELDDLVTAGIETKTTNSP